MLRMKFMFSMIWEKIEKWHVLNGVLPFTGRGEEVNYAKPQMGSLSFNITTPIF